MATRRERVVMDLESNVPEGMLKGAAAVAVLRAELKRLSGDYDRLSTTSVQSSRVSQAVAKDLDKVSASSNRADQSINQLTGRIRLFADLAAILGPALIPLGGAGLAGVMALAAQMGAAAIAGGVLIGSLQGVGDSLTAMREADLEPTAENLAELDLIMARLSPSAREFARQAYGLLPALKALRDTGAANLFPGLIESIDNLEMLQSELERIMRTNGRVVGNMAADITESLASDRWAEFFQFVATDGPQAVRLLTKTVGSLTHGLAELWMAFDPVNDDAGRWMRDIARDFDEWASKLDQTQGFEDFVEYLHTTGPLVEDMLGSLFNALVQIVQAAAPLGGPVLQGMTALLDVLASIAGSDVGPTLMAAVTAMALLTRATTLYDKAAGSAFGKHIGNIRGLGQALDTTDRNQQRATMSVTAFAAAEKDRDEKTKKGLGSLGKGAALMGGLALASTGAADSIGLTNTMSLAMMGLMVGPWGAAVGGAIGLALDLGQSHDDTAQRVADLTSTFDAQTGAITENTRAKINQQAQDAGLLSAAEELGLKASTVTDAIMGNVEAQNLLNAAVDAYGVDNSITSDENLAKTYTEQEIAAIHAARAATLLRQEVPGLSTVFGKAATEAAQFGRGMDSAGESTSRAESQVEAFERSIGRLNRLLSDRAGLRDYEQSLDDFTKSMKENGRNWDINTQKGRDNQAALDDIVGTTAKVAEGLRGAARQKFLTGAIADLRDMAGRFDIPQNQIRLLIEKLREANGVRVRPVIDADTVAAMSAIERVRNAMAGLKDRSLTIRVTQTGAAISPGFGPVGSADGSTVPHAPGPYRDQFLYALAQREEVVSNRRGQADRYRPALKAINADMPRHIIRGMLADGGTAGSSTKKPRRGFDLDSIGPVDPTRGQLQAMIQVAEMQAAAAADQDWAARAAQVAAQDQLDAAETTAEAAENNLKAAQQQYDTFRESVAGQFKGSLTGGGLAGLTQTLSRDTNAGQSMDQVLQALVAAGLDVTGPAAGLYRELANSEDQQTANELLAAGPEMIAALEKQYAERDAANAARADRAAQATFGPMVEAQQQAYNVAQAQLAQAQAAESAAAARHWQTSAQLDTLTGQVANLAGDLAGAINSAVRGGRRQ